MAQNTDTSSWKPAVAVGLAVLAVIAGLSIVLDAQGRGGRGRALGLPQTQQFGPEWVYDGGAFVFCRLAFRRAFDGDGGGWSVDYPRADQNFPFRLGELTSTRISRNRAGDPNHVIVTPDDPNLFQCPFVMMTEPGAAFFTEEEAAALGDYIAKGGFLWADDFWGPYAMHIFMREIRKALPEADYPAQILDEAHPVFNIAYVIRDMPQIPSINFWYRTGFQTSERGFDSRDNLIHGLVNDRGRVVVLMTHNTDVGDAWEREGDSREYFDAFAGYAYALGINIFLYAMTN